MDHNTDRAKLASSKIYERMSNDRIGETELPYFTPTVTLLRSYHWAMLFSTVNSDTPARPFTASNSRSNECKGNGGCLILAENTLTIASEYIQNPDIVCTHNCQPKECPNYLFCKRKCPEWVLQCNCGLCDDCSATFGMKLQFIANPPSKQLCQICQNYDSLYVLYKHCKHYACRNCFSYSFYGSVYEYYDVENEPNFPYPKEIEEEYYDDQDDPKWRKDILIQKYLQDWNKWDENRENYRETFLQTRRNQADNNINKTGKNQENKKKVIDIEENENALLTGQCPLCQK